MVNLKFERMLANFCSPVMMHEKVSNLFSVSKFEMPEINQIIKKYNGILNSYDLNMSKICECDNRVLIMVYNKSLLNVHFNDTEVIEILSRFGYSNLKTPEDYIGKLKSRIKVNNFPHEIGIFLGYPIKDVQGFIENKGQNYKYCGYWKVYNNVVSAKILFSSYDNMRKVISNRLDCGESIENILSQLHKELHIA